MDHLQHYTMRRVNRKIKQLSMCREAVCARVKVYPKLFKIAIKDHPPYTEAHALIQCIGNLILLLCYPQILQLTLFIINGTKFIFHIVMDLFIKDLLYGLCNIKEQIFISEDPITHKPISNFSTRN